MAKNKYSAVFALVSHIQQFDSTYTYHDAVSDFTNGRTRSLSEISDMEIPYLVAMLQGKSHNPKQTAKTFNEKNDKQRKAIIAIFRKKGRSVQDAIKWAEERGVNGVKKRFNDYTGQELYKLTIAAEQWA